MSNEKITDQPHHFEVPGLAVHLENGATVIGSLHDDAVCWAFEKDSITTRLKLSHEAMEAITAIWQELRGGAA